MFYSQYSPFLYTERDKCETHIFTSVIFFFYKKKYFCFWFVSKIIFQTKIFFQKMLKQNILNTVLCFSKYKSVSTHFMHIYTRYILERVFSVIFEILICPYYISKNNINIFQALVSVNKPLLIFQIFIETSFYTLHISKKRFFMKDKKEDWKWKNWNSLTESCLCFMWFGKYFQFAYWFYSFL